MSKEQVIFLDKETFHPNGNSLIDNDTKVLNILIVDICGLTDFHIIGKKVEWSPLIWLMFEKERIGRLDTLRICLGMAKLTSKSKNILQTLFPNLEIQYCEMLLGIGSTINFKAAKQLAQRFRESPKDKHFFYSSGSLRIQRFLLIYWLQQHNISNISNVGHPEIGQQSLRSLKNWLTRFSNHDYSDYSNEDKRFFGDIRVDEFNNKIYPMRCRSMISIVTSYPYFDYAESNYDEKVAFTFASKSLPFFLGNCNDNSNLPDLGFRTYAGFDYSADKIENFVQRWQSTFESNKKFLFDTKNNRDIYENNLEVIEYNFDLLLSTDWDKKFLRELEKMPAMVRQLISSYM
jgi:hypothetical protein